MPRPSDAMDKVSATAGTKAGARLALLHEGDFRRLCFVSGAGEAVRGLEILATSLFVFRATGSPFDVILINFVRAFPLVVFGPLSGVLAGRLNRKMLLAGTVGMLAATALTLTALVLSDQIRVWHIAVGSFLSGIYFASDFSIRRTMLADVAGIDRTATAVGLDQATRSATRMVGPVVGGLVLDHVGLSGAYLIAAALYLANLVMIARLDRTFAALAGGTQSFFADLVEGFRFIRSSRIIAGVLVVTIIMNLMVFSYQTMVAVIGESVLMLSATAIGVLVAAEGLGSTIGGITMAVLAPSKWYGRLFIGGSLLAAVCIIGFSQATSFAVACLLLLIAGFGMSGYVTMQSTITLVVPPPAVKARVMGTLSICIGFSPIGMLYLGKFTDFFPPTMAVLVTAGQGLIGLLVALALFAPLRRH